MRIRSRFLTKLFARVTILLIRLLYATCRCKVVTETPNTNPYDRLDGERYLYSVWHDHILATLFTGRPIGAAALVSKHQDGGFLAEALEMMKITTIRGSSSRGGAQALRELLVNTRDLHITITPDGPRGPRRIAKSGLVYLASQTGRKIIPTSYACRRSWTIKGNWTDMLLPIPFTVLYAICGRPIEVPSNLDKQGIQDWTKTLQEEMERAEWLIDGVADGKSLNQMIVENAEQPDYKAA